MEKKLQDVIAELNRVYRRLEFKGIQMLNQRGKGDMLIRIIVEVPRQLTQRQKELLREFDSLSGKKNPFSASANPAAAANAEPEKKGFFGKKKK